MNVSPIKTFRIGSSDIASICGLNRNKSALDVFMEKTGRKEKFKGNDQTLLGNLLEPVIGQYFQHKNPQFKVKSDNVLRHHEKFPEFVSKTDYLIVDDNDREGSLETKSGKIYQADSWEDDEIPPMALCQLHWCMDINNHGYGYAAALLANDSDKWYSRRVEYDKDIIEGLHTMAHGFMKCLRDDTPPEVSSNDFNNIQSLFKTRHDKIVQLPAGAIPLFSEFGRLDEKRLQFNRESKAIKDRQDEIENKLFMMMGDATAGEINGHRIEYIPYVRAGYTVAPIDKMTTKIRFPKVEKAKTKK